MWNRYDIPKHSVIAWMAALGKLRTKAHLFRIGVVTERMCLLCGLQEESIEHCFFNACIVSRVMLRFADG